MQIYRLTYIHIKNLAKSEIPCNFESSNKKNDIGTLQKTTFKN